MSFKGQPMRQLDRQSFTRRYVLACALALGTVVVSTGWNSAYGQLPNIRVGEAVPRDVREIYDRGLAFLASTQSPTGEWPGQGYNGPGVTGMAVMTFLASGEDPNYGPYSSVIRKGLRNIILQQDASTGYLGPQGHGMYDHGFAMLALAEAYGTVDDRELWAGESKKSRSIGQALELAVRCAVTSQKKNQYGGWRYSPDSTDADTSVSGAVMVGLLAARNAGVEVPDEVIDKAIKYFMSMTDESGFVGYSGGLGGFGESTARTAIATLVYAVSRRKDLPQYKSTIKKSAESIESTGGDHYLEYTRYYQAQALFQGDVAAWEKWNKLLIRQLKDTQAADGSFQSQFGPSCGTSLSLLGLALNYRFLPIYER
jgi:hypothetical protein